MGDAAAAWCAYSVRPNLRMTNDLLAPSPGHELPRTFGSVNGHARLGRIPVEEVATQSVKLANRYVAAPIDNLFVCHHRGQPHGARLLCPLHCLVHGLAFGYYHVNEANLVCPLR